MRRRARSVRPHLVYRNAAKGRFALNSRRKTMAVKAVPEGWHSVTPRLFVHEAAKLVDFLIHAFGATGTFRTDGPSEIRIGDSIVMVGEVDLREAMPTFLYL